MGLNGLSACRQLFCCALAALLLSAGSSPTALWQLYFQVQVAFVLRSGSSLICMTAASLSALRQLFRSSPSALQQPNFFFFSFLLLLLWRKDAASFGGGQIVT